MKTYIPVLCCSKSKLDNDFYYNNQLVKFIAAKPKASSDNILYSTPDDFIPCSEKTWKNLIQEQSHENLICAYKLYKNSVYRSLFHKFGECFYILSAGWGIIRSSFKIPNYNITFSKQADSLTKRKNDIKWDDFNHLQEDIVLKKIPEDAIIILFAGVDYHNIFYSLTADIINRRIIMCKSIPIEKRNGYEYEKYNERISTNWFYKAAINNRFFSVEIKK